MAPCTPALSFVANGPAGKLPIAAPDPEPPAIPNSPTFSQQACDLLGAELCGAMDPISSIDELPAALDAVDALTAAADANLDAILLELDTVVGQGQVDQAFTDFAAAQPGAQTLLDEGAAVTLPTLGAVPLVTPGGVASISPGAPPEQGGIAPAGGAPYVLHFPVPLSPSGPGLLIESHLDGPNPPFVSLEGFDTEINAAGKEQSFALININPAAAGTWNGQVAWKQNITITGIKTVVDAIIPVTVVIQ